MTAAGTWTASQRATLESQPGTGLSVCRRTDATAPRRQAQGYPAHQSGRQVLELGLWPFAGVPERDWHRQNHHDPLVRVLGSVTDRPLSVGLTAWPAFMECGAAGLRCLADGGSHDAKTALRHALQQGKLDVVALGPMTNPAAVLVLEPALASRVTRVVAVNARVYLDRPSQAPHVADSEERTAAGRPR